MDFSQVKLRRVYRESNLRYTSFMIYLIGGSPCSGKSTVAKALANKLSIPVIGTDIIRAWMQKMLKREEYPDLFHAVGLAADEYLTKNSPSEIVEKEVIQQRIVSKGILAFIEADYEWDSYVIEGTGITPELITDAQKLNKYISALVLVDKNSDRIRHTIFERGLWGEPHTYSDELKEKEIQWIIDFNNWYENESKKLHTPYHIVEKRETLISEVFASLNVI